MSPFRPTGRTTWRIKVPTQHGGTRDLSTGTRDKATANAIERMVQALGPRGKRAWDLLNPVLNGTLSLGRLYDAYSLNALDQLRAQMDDVNLEDKVEPWQQWLLGRVDTDTADRYDTHLRTLMPKGKPFPRSLLTPEAAETWVSSRPVSGPTKRKYFAALASFVAYLRTVKVLTTNPLADLSPPPASDPRVEFLELPEVKRVLEASPAYVRPLFAFLYGTGCDLSVALELTKRDVDPKLKEVRARGTKAANRDRVVTVADWAWPEVAGLLSSRLPDALLFEGLTRWTASDVHREIVRALKLYRKGINLHGARHHWAVRMVRAGTPIELVARQLGNDPVTCQRYYSRFVPTAAERRKWEKAATRHEKVAAGGLEPPTPTL